MRVADLLGTMIEFYKFRVAFTKRFHFPKENRYFRLIRKGNLRRSWEERCSGGGKEVGSNKLGERMKKRKIIEEQKEKRREEMGLAYGLSLTHRI